MGAALADNSQQVWSVPLYAGEPHICVTSDLQLYFFLDTGINFYG